MNKSEAINQIQQSLKKMDAILGEPVFTEWALIVKLGGKWILSAYCGNRRQTFAENFQEDMRAMRDILDFNETGIGNYGFSHEGHGSGFDAYMCVAENAFVLFNHLNKSTTEIVANPHWLDAQKYFALLLETFMASPLDISEGLAAKADPEKCDESGN
ncbi:MAG: hypothetical protein MUC65_09310 [Pontiellaceae bacterium]|jgi:hypothetical protein|nr:hypothetical protein [Pontiellaceae bacterium]